MAVLLLDEASRSLLRYWLMGRERILTIPFYRWCAFLSAATAIIHDDELEAICDCTSPKIIDLLKLSEEEKRALIESMKFQLEKDGYVLQAG